jgi:2-C-methyl-D-erythritol 4-phosphate cytidylyltransferase / 2-C-methyl-D-erythritol 2,4-cyclodiphosphate synthase
VRDVAVILVAAGRGERLGSHVPKAFVSLAGRPILEHAAKSALGCSEVATLIAVVPPGWEDEARGVLQGVGPCAVLAGGATRQGSVRAALAFEATSSDVLVCHDAARPFASSALFEAVVAALADADGAVPILPLVDTVKRVQGSAVASTETRSDLVLAQTPQAFRAAALRDAHERAEREGVELTDDAAALERAGFRVSAVAGEPRNFKITTPEDLERAEAIAAELARG